MTADRPDARVEAAAKAALRANQPPFAHPVAPWERQSESVRMRYRKLAAATVAAADEAALAEASQAPQRLRSYKAVSGMGLRVTMPDHVREEAVVLLTAQAAEIERLRDGLATVVRRYDELGDERKLRVHPAILGAINDARALLAPAPGERATEGGDG